MNERMELEKRTILSIGVRAKIDKWNVEQYEMIIWLNYSTRFDKVNTYV